MACMVVTKTFSTPNLRCSGARAMTSPMAEQLGLVTMNPRLFLNHSWVCRTFRCSPLTSGITRGTSACMRKALELETTPRRSEEHTSELQSPDHLVCRLLLEKKKNNTI